MRHLWTMSGVLLLLGCSFDWSAFDPREHGSGSAGSAASTGGSGGAPGTGGSAGALGGGGTGGAELGPFTNVSLIAELSHPEDDDDPSVGADGLELIFNTSREGTGSGADFWRATRTSLSEPWGDPMALSALNTLLDETNGALSWDGLSYWFSSSRDVVDDNLYVAERTTTASGWSAPVIVSELSSANAFDEIGGLSGDGLSAIVCSSVSGSYALYATSRPTLDDPWAPPTAIDELDVSSSCSAWLSSDALTVYFDAYVEGNGTDIFRSTRASRTAAWSTPLPVDELNTTTNDSDPCLTADQRLIVFARATSSGPRELYSASR